MVPTRAHLPYRPDIDGLRAVAVLPVLLFHAGLSTFSGGFVGVDIFFVISGYLITSIILADGPRFSLAGFYTRRARRILPPLLLVLAVSAAVAWVTLLPGDMKAFGRSMAAVAVFGSNVLFWRESGYFDAAAEFKPLLHTWSLSVEEQWYVLFPIPLLFFYKRSPRLAGWALAACLVVSFAMAQYFSLRSPSAAYYLLPTRAWELALGALLAVYLRERPAMPSAGISNALAAGGMLLVLGSVVLLDEHTPFPGVYALAPTLGAALVIFAAHQGTVVGRALASRWLVGIGLVSYSTYLWHQPLFAFARHVSSVRITAPTYLLLVAVSLVLGWLSWRFVEQPFRDPKRVSAPRLWATCTVGSLVLAAVGVAASFSEGFPARLPPDKAAFAAHFENSTPAMRYFAVNDIPGKFRLDCDFYDLDAYRVGRSTRVPREAISLECHTRDARRLAIFIWGDSHAQQYRPGLQQELPADWQILQVASSACPPAIEVDLKSIDYCRRSNAIALRAIADARPDVVLIAQAQHHDPAKLIDLVSEVRRRGARDVVVVGPSPQWNRVLPSMVIAQLWDDTPRRTFVGVNQRSLDADRLLRVELPRARIRYVSPAGYFCTSEGCTTYLGEDRMSGLVSWDDGHLAPHASQAFARDVLVPFLTRSEAPDPTRRSGPSI